MTLFLAHVTPFPRTFIIKDNTNDGKNLPSCPFPVISFINGEATGCVNDEAIGTINKVSIDAPIAIIAPRLTPSCFFISCFNFSVAPSINTPDFSVTQQF